MLGFFYFLLKHGIHEDKSRLSRFTLYQCLLRKKAQKKSASCIQAVKQAALLEKENFLNKSLHPTMQLPLVLPQLT